MEKQIITTSDGSNSIFLPEMDEHYHSMHGAITESEHIFVKNGLIAASTKFKHLRVFEVGMGTGLNVLTTFLAAKKHNLNVEMHTIEAFPLSWTELSQLNFSNQLSADYSDFQRIHQCEWEVDIKLSNDFSLHKYYAKLQDQVLEEATFNLIYFDAFAPEKQAEMWTEAIFKKLYAALATDGILVTYCVKGDVRRCLQSLGFEVEKLPGPIGGKREMMRGVKRS